MYRLRLEGCSTWVEVVLHFYDDFLREYAEACISTRAPTINASFKGRGVDYGTFALPAEFQPFTVLSDICQGKLEFTPSALEKAVARIENHEAKVKRMSDGDDSDEENGDAEENQQEDGQDATPKRPRLPPLQPAFQSLMSSLESSLARQNLPSAIKYMRILKDISPLIKVSKKSGADNEPISKTAANYVREAHKNAKEAAKQKKQEDLSDSDSSHSGSPVGNSGPDSPPPADPQSSQQPSSGASPSSVSASSLPDIEEID